jgi:type I restriction enzyme S subunit
MVKLVNIDAPVMSDWFELPGCRLDSKPYLSGAMEAKALLAKLTVKKEPLQYLTSGYFSGIYNGPQFVRNYVDSSEHGVPFLTSASMLLADISNVGLLNKKDAFSSKLSYLRLEEDMILISCSGTVGRMVYAGPNMDGVWSSQDILKVVPNPNKISRLSLRLP